MKVGDGFHLAMSPERVDPGREDWTTKTTPKVLGGITPACTERAADVYRRAIDTIVEVSTPEAAELTKLLENIFRSVNIALVNELAQLCDRMNIDVWEVVNAAATKPFGFMRFSPGPGLGGHCIPIDPFYLTWKAREFGFYTRVHRARRQGQRGDAVLLPLDGPAGAEPPRAKAMKGAKVLVLGVAYKPDIADMRESPAVKLISLLNKAGADVSYHDPHVPAFDEHGLEMASVAYEPAAYDCVVIATDHNSIDYDELVDEAPLVVDLRNATGGRAPPSPTCSSFDRRSGRARLLGPEPRPQLRRPRPTLPGCATSTTSFAASSRTLSRARGSTASSTTCSRRRARRAS